MTIELDCKMKRLILIFVMVFGVVLSLDARDIYIFSVGVSDYPGTINDLTFPAKDAKSMVRLYKQQGSGHTYLLTDANATRATIIANAQNFFKNAQADDIVVFFFSGHGYEGGFCAYDKFLTYQDVKSLFAQCKSQNKMIFADACHAGALRSKQVSKSRSKLPKSVMLFLSSRDDEVSYDGNREMNNGRDMNNGVFTACLLSGLKGGADLNRDRIITARELFQAVSQGVHKMTRDKQHPVMWGKFDHNMPVMVWK